MPAGFFEKNLLVENRKIEQNNWILHIQISLGAIFLQELIIFIFWTKFVQKEHFRSKTEKKNSTIEFCIFKSV